jgi:hypothetical protein
MFAHRLATFCLLTSSLSIPAAAASVPAPGKIAVSLRLRTGTIRAAAFEELQKELAVLMYTAGVTTQWEDPTSYRDVNGYTVVVDLEGDCSVPFHADTASWEDGTPIGSTATAENHLLPFVNVNCSVLNALLAPYTADQPDALREFVFGRALGRVLAHELYHIVTQSEDHSGAGVAKARFSAADLMKNEFEFTEMALDRIRTSQSAESTAGAVLDSAVATGYADGAADAK